LRASPMRLCLAEVAFLDPASASNGGREAIGGAPRVFCNAGSARIREYRWLNVSLAIGGSVAPLKTQIRLAVRPAEPPKRPSRHPWLGRFFVSHNGGSIASLNEVWIVQRSHMSE
jgi:hypothetical protein